MAEGYEVFKVVLKRGDLLLSCFAPSDLQVSYNVGKKSLPKVGKLFCFDNINSAKDFIKDMGYFNSEKTFILRCETNSFEFLTHIESIPDGACDNNAEDSYRNFWKDPQIWEESHCGTEIPNGTVFCDYVIPLEVVE